MQSETETMKKVEVTPSTFSLKTDKPARDIDQRAFWNQLRRFYRTGQKFENQKTTKLRSVFSRLSELQNISVYPFRVNDQEFQFNADLPFQLLNQQIIDYQSIRIKDFKSKLEHLITGLKKLLDVKETDKDPGNVYDFATEIIAFDKLSGLMPTKEGSKLTPSRSKQLSKLIDDLKDGLISYESKESVILDSGKFLKSNKYLDKAEVKATDGKKALEETEKELKIKMKHLVQLIRSIRISELEIDGEYKEEIHHDFYENFSWYRLTEAEKSLLQPVILIIDQSVLMKQIDAFTRLLTLNWPFKILVLNKGLASEPDGKTEWEEASHSFRQELSTITIAHRNTFVFQSTLSQPGRLAEEFQNFIKANNPAVIHLLVPQTFNSDDLMVSNAATLSRHFPVIKYNPSDLVNRLNLRGNENAMENWVKYEINFSLNDQKTERLTVEFTYADYKAFFDNKVSELMIVPPAHESKDLVLLPEYLSLKENELVGKLPYIWLTDQKGDLIKAVVPNAWVVSCQERIDFWSFIQELAKVKGQKAEEKTTEIKPEEKPSTEKMLAIRAAHEHELKKVREEAVSQAAGQLLHALLNGDNTRKG